MLSVVVDVEVGYVGELLPAVAEAADLPGRVIVAELDLDLVLSLAAAKPVAASLSGFPAATQDVSLVVGADVPAAEVRERARRGRRGALLESLRLVDDYRGAGVPDGAKSLTFALRFRAPDRTLTAAEATEAKLAGVAVAASASGRRCASSPGACSRNDLPARKRCSARCPAGCRVSASARRAGDDARGSADGGTGCRGRAPSAGMGA